MSFGKRWLMLAACVGLAVAAGGCARSTADADIAPDMQQALALRTAQEGGDSEATAEQAITGAGWGTLKGVFQLDGQIPQLPALDTQGKDPAACGSVVPDPSLQVDPGSKGIAYVLIFARKVSRVKNPEIPAEAGPALFDQKKCVFLSPVLALRVGQTMLVKNSDPVSHNTKIDAPGNPPSNLTLAPFASATYMYVKQLALPSQVVCSIHPWMSAYVIARNDPYYAVTGQDGSFEIADLPAGEPIEFQVWHARAQGGLQARPDWKRGRFQATIPPDGVLDLGVIQVPVGAFGL